MFCALLGPITCTEFAPASDVDINGAPDDGATAETELLEALPDRWRCLMKRPWSPPRSPAP